MFAQAPIATHSRLVALCALLLLINTPVSVLADPPPGYYDSVDTSSPEALRATLHAVIDGHTKIPYTSGSTDTWDVLNLADEDPYNSTRILDVYQNRTFPKHSGGNNDYNREHTWPNSYGFPDDGSSNKPYTDCHQLFLCDIDYNGARGSRIYDWCTVGCNTYTADDYDGQSGVNLTRNATPVGVWETWIGRRGDVARAQFYLDVRYEGDGSEPDLILTDDVALIVSCQTGDNEPIAYMGLLTTLLQWHLDDPVDDKERNRNDVVQNFQGNRNPFIDHPEWVVAIFDAVDAVRPGELPDYVLTDARIAAIYPNPFNPQTRIDFFLTAPGQVRLNVFSTQGRLVRTLVDETRPAGDAHVYWDGRNDAGRQVASGAYFCRLHYADRSDTRKLLLLK